MRFRMRHGRPVPAVDDVPAAFTIPAVGNAALGAAITSAPFTPSGFNTPLVFTAVGGTLSKGGGYSTSVTVAPGETLTARLLSSASFSTLTAATVTGGGISATFDVTTIPDPAYLGPSLSWNGTALSGGSPPVDPTYVVGGAKPAIHWLQPSDLRLVNNLVIGVDADASGGVAYVDFWAEGGTRRVTTPSFYTDLDANLTVRTRWGYWVTLDAAAFRAISTTGEARIYATAHANDPTMQDRTIGGPLIDGSGFDTGTYGGNYPLSVFPRILDNDWSKTIAASGADYTTLDAAITAARTAGAEAPLFTFTQTGNYEVTDVSRSPTVYANGKGFATLAAAPGVTATLGRAAAFSPTGSPVAQGWTPGWDGVEFRGAGIVLNLRNWSGIAFSAKPPWFNGCTVTNSIGTRDTYYWNGGLHPGLYSGLPGYWDDCLIEYLSAGLTTQRYVRGCRLKEVAGNLGDLFTGTHYVASNYLNGYSLEYFRGNVTGSEGLSIAYSNAGRSATTATVSRGGPNTNVSESDVAGYDFTLNIDGGAVLTLRMGTTNADTYPSNQSICDAINAFGNGWSAAVLNGKGLMRASTLFNSTKTTASNAFNTTLVVPVGKDLHCDWWQGYASSNLRVNVIIRWNTSRGLVNVNSTLFNDDAGWHSPGTSYSYDHIIKGNIWVGGGQQMSVGGKQFFHFVFEDNVHELWVTRYQDSTPDIYTSIRNNIVGGVNTLPSFNAGWSNDAPWINNFYGNPNGYGSPSMNTAPNSGNYLYANGGSGNTGITGPFQALFRDYAAGDFRPAISGALMSNQKTKANTYDGTGVAYRATDVVGARSQDAAAPWYPF